MDDRKLSETIKYNLKIKKIPPEKAAKKLGISRTTYFARLRNPDEFTRYQIRILCKITDMTVDDFF